jgi:dTDP-glucose 4,6-dehydratase
MNILITGCFGFIGFNFVQYILKKHGSSVKITGVDNLNNAYSAINFKNFKHKNFTFHKLDINNIDSLNSKNTTFDLIINFAAESHVDTSIYNPEAFIHSNISGLQSLLNFARKYGIKRTIHLSTDEVYGSSKKDFFTEKDKLNPSSPYSASKAGADMIINSYQKTYDMDISLIRPANNYGPFQQPEKLIPFSISKILKDENIEIYGDGSNIRHWLHVEDTVRGILKIIEKGGISEIYNIGSGEYFTNNEIALNLISINSMSEDSIIYIQDRPGHDFRYAADFSKLLDIGWRPKVAFNEGIETTFLWYSENQSWLFKDIETINQNRNKRFI